MSPELVGALGFATLLVLLALRAPVGLVLLGVGVGGIGCLSLIEDHIRFVPFMRQFKTLFWSLTANYELAVIPLFVLLGALCARTGFGRDLFTAAAIGGRREGLAYATLATCAGFGAVCGSSLATATTLGQIAWPEMRRGNFSPGFAAALLAAASTLGILIPPSVVLVVFALIVEVSIIKMFQAALVPALLAIVMFAAVIFIQLRRGAAIENSPSAQQPQLSSEEKRVALRRAAPVVLVLLGVIISLASGLFSPTPAAAIAVAAMLLTGWLMRRLPAAVLADALADCARNAGMLLLVIFGATVLSIFFARTGLPIALAEWAKSTEMPPLAVLAAALLFLLVLGCFMDSLSSLLAVVPFFWPALLALNGGEHVSADASAYGLDADELKIWFGILCLGVVELGLITPPLGLNVFVVNKLCGGVGLGRIFRGLMPFIGVELLRLGLILAVPAIALVAFRLSG